MNELNGRPVGMPIPGYALPSDIEFDNIIPSTSNVVEKVEKAVYDSRNYLDFSIPEGQKTREITIRLLPVIPETKTFFQIVHLHNIPVNKELKPNKSGKKAYMCLSSKNAGINHELYGSKCPVCEAQQKLWKQWREEINEVKKKELAKEAGALDVREYCIVRCIERGNEKDGPKFWRIPLRQDQTDAYHKIILLGETRRKEGEEAGVDINIFSLYKGRDLKITFTEGTGAPTVVDKSISTPITTDEELLCKWYYDEKKWSDVFSTKPYDYLKLAFEGEVPWYDKDNKCWISKKEFDTNKQTTENTVNKQIEDAEKNFKSNSPVTPVKTPDVLATSTVVPTYTPSISEDDDLPF